MSGKKKFYFVLSMFSIRVMYVNRYRCKKMQIVVINFKPLSPKPVFPKTLSVIPREPVIQEFQKNISDVFKRNCSGARVEFFLI